MKLAHISILPAYSPGVFKKLEAKAKAAQEANLDIDFYLLNPVEDAIDNNLILIKKTFSFLPLGFFRTIAFRLWKLKTVEKKIDLAAYDYIVFRYPLVDSIGTQKFIRKYGHKIITEHHTDEVNELYSIGRWVDLFRAKIEERYADDFLRQVKGIIGVTQEICELELEKSGAKPYKMIPNGIEVESVAFTKFAPFDGSKFTMVFVASEFVSWQGLEGLLEGLREYRGGVPVELNLIGLLSQKQLDLIAQYASPNIAIYARGKQFGEALDRYLSQAHVAISSLALYKKNMKEACPLKSREYIARGLPFVYAYDDNDLSGDEDFALKLTPEMPIDIEEIITFVQKCSDNKDLSEEMRAFAVDKLDWKVKLGKMVDFVEGLE